MVKFYVCSDCRKYYKEDDYIKLKLIKLEPRTRSCERCGAEMTHQKCFRQEFYNRR